MAKLQTKNGEANILRQGYGMPYVNVWTVNGTLLRINGIPIREFITSFEYTYNTEKEDECSITIKTRDTSLSTNPLLMPRTPITVQWGWVYNYNTSEKADNTTFGVTPSKVMSLIILGHKIEFTPDGISMILVCAPSAVLAKVSAPNPISQVHKLIDWMEMASKYGAGGFQIIDHRTHSWIGTELLYLPLEEIAEPQQTAIRSIIEAQGLDPNKSVMTPSAQAQIVEVVGDKFNDPIEIPTYSEKDKQGKPLLIITKQEQGKYVTKGSAKFIEFVAAFEKSGKMLITGQSAANNAWLQFFNLGEMLGDGYNLRARNNDFILENTQEYIKLPLYTYTYYGGNGELLEVNIKSSLTEKSDVASAVGVDEDGNLNVSLVTTPSSNQKIETTVSQTKFVQPTGEQMTIKPPAEEEEKPIPHYEGSLDPVTGQPTGLESKGYAYKKNEPEKTLEEKEDEPVLDGTKTSLTDLIQKASEERNWKDTEAQIDQIHDYIESLMTELMYFQNTKENLNDVLGKMVFSMANLKIYRELNVKLHIDTSKIPDTVSDLTPEEILNILIHTQVSLESNTANKGVEARLINSDYVYKATTEDKASKSWDAVKTALQLSRDDISTEIDKSTQTSIKNPRGGLAPEGGDIQRSSIVKIKVKLKIPLEIPQRTVWSDPGLSDALIDRIGSDLISQIQAATELEATVIGNPFIDAPANLDFENIGAYRGIWFVSKATHKIDANGYTTELDCKNKEVIIHTKTINLKAEIPSLLKHVNKFLKDLEGPEEVMVGINTKAYTNFEIKKAVTDYTRGEMMDKDNGLMPVIRIAYDKVKGVNMIEFIGYVDDFGNYSPTSVQTPAMIQLEKVLQEATNAKK
jgi:hypothetical protein